MNFAQSLFGTAIAGAIVVVSSASSALAANLTHSWDVTSHKSNDHAFTFFKKSAVRAFGDDVDFQFHEACTLNEYDDGTARLVGTIVNQKNDDQRWDVDILFTSTEMNQTKGRSESFAIANNWRFYELSEEQSGHMLTGLGEYEGSYLNLYDRSNGKFPGQLGLAANDKNSNMGFSFWFGYSGLVNGQTVTNINDGDINVNLAASIPEPSLGLLSLAVLTGSFKLLKRKEEKREV
ncbi:MAG: hypothetical protein F6K36_30815 [Symploca sp. SIO3C6]|nr:hypothetical protein [Symploca sp. SIO3C6]